ncbi:MAG: hypothetical protein CVU39_20445 [Chloroflexi bacterium HGW-Chloroflexi-10]|nr:MAG: hypothetical protein CVU39_20445 [Chloroflexi bacterium HGW-Chloroflexi-10]
MKFSNTDPSSRFSKISPDRRRRYARWNLDGVDGMENYLAIIAARVEPSMEFILFNSILAVIFVAAFLLDQFALFILALLISPLLSPIIGLAYAAIFGTWKFYRLGIISTLISALSAILAGLFSGFIGRQLTGRNFILWHYFAGFSWANIILIFCGVILIIATFVRNPKQTGLVANVALAYGFYLPLASAAFGLGIGDHFGAFTGLSTFGIQFGVAIFLAAGSLIVLGMRPDKIIRSWGFFGSILVLIAISIYLIAGPGLQQQLKDPVQATPIVEETPAQVTQTITETTLPIILPTLLIEKTATIKPEISEVNTATPTLPPTITPTITLTPLPTPVWAEIRVEDGNGANVRAEPGYSGRLLSTVLNGTVVEVLPDVMVADGVTWIKIRLPDQTEGWIVRSLIVSATPAPEW